MARWQGTTAERGYGHEHKAERQRRLALYRPGDICAHGGEALNYPPPRTVKDKYGTRLVSPHLDLPHTADRSGYLPGLACARHNRADGARRKNRRHRVRRTLTLAKPAPDGGRYRCQYCGQPAPCARPLCHVAATQAARMAARDGMTMAQATAAMAARVTAAMQRRTG